MAVLYLSLLVEDSSIELRRVQWFAKKPRLDLDWWLESRLLKPEAIRFIHAPEAFCRGLDQQRVLENISGIIAGGSIYSANEGRPWQLWAADIFRAGMHKDIPILGVCGGHQLLAYAAGMSSVPVRETYRFGYDEIVVSASARKDPLLRGLPERFIAAFSHGEHVAATRCLASTVGGQCAILRYGDRSTWGLQFHPELTLSRMHQIAVARGRRLKIPSQGVDTRWPYLLVKNFLQLTLPGTTV